jgi:UDP-4-amino-4,6-dideoxy-N-acetyl-beta-L-altrosamine transaminase
MIPYGRQDINNDDIDSVIEVLKSDFLTQGPIVPFFEEQVKNLCGSKYAVASNSATSSLHAACHALEVSDQDIIWTSANTFAASSNCGLYCGATVDFVDIDPLSYNICPDKLETKLKIAKKEKKLPKVVIPVHLTGQSCNMKKIYELSVKYNFKIIEDASHAIGAKYLDDFVGSCNFSDITVFSFHPVKIITTGEGGMATTNNKTLAKKLEIFRSHGITRDIDLLKNDSAGPWYYEQIDLGYNYRMTDIHAALGISQIKRIDSITKKRHEIADIYNNKLNNLPLRTPNQNLESFSSYHLYVIRLNLDEINITHKEFFVKMRNEGILVNLHYMPVYFHPYYKKLGFKKGLCPEAERYYSDAVSIPMFPTLKNDDQEKVIDVIHSLLK